MRQDSPMLEEMPQTYGNSRKPELLGRPAAHLAKEATRACLRSQMPTRHSSMPRTARLTPVGRAKRAPNATQDRKYDLAEQPQVRFALLTLRCPTLLCSPAKLLLNQCHHVPERIKIGRRGYLVIFNRDSEPLLQECNEFNDASRVDHPAQKRRGLR